MGSNLNRMFSRMGARIKVLEVDPSSTRFRAGAPSRTEVPNIAIDIGHDKSGEFFEIRTLRGGKQELDVMNVIPEEKHLVLLSRQFDDHGKLLAKQKFLCGRDEKHWFIAAIPESEPVSTVAGARIALKPEAVRNREQAVGVSRQESFRRRNSAYVRQGEWFFIPEANVKMHPMYILRNEPLSRGTGSNPHWAEQCYRTGGETVYVSRNYPSGISTAKYQALPQGERKLGFRMMTRDSTVYVRGAIRHVDHATITLDGWHRVLMNTENRSIAMRSVVFLD